MDRTGDALSDGPAPDARMVRDALRRITSSPPLAGSERLSRLLSYVVEEALAGRGDRIISYRIGVDLFGKPESFDPTVDTIVRVEAGRLRRSMAEYYRKAGADDPVVIELPRGAYIPTFQLRRTFEASTEPLTQPEDKAKPDRGPALIVVPFVTHSRSDEDRIFTDGLTEEVVAHLARFRELFVFSRSTSAKLTDDGVSIAQLRETLGVDYVLHGSLRKSADTVRVTVQLVDAATDGHLLADKLERPCTPDGIFEIQDDIARIVAGRVADRFGPIGRSVVRAHRGGRSKRWETYYWTTRFHDYYARHDPESHLEVRAGLEAALERDPESSDGWAALAGILLDEHRFHINERAEYPALDKALDCSQRAVACDPESAAGHQMLALCHFHRRDHTDFRIAADRSMELNPGHSTILADIGHCYSVLGNWDRGLPLVERAIELSPVHPGWFHWPHAWQRSMNDDPEGAIRELKKGPTPGFFWYHAFLAWFYAEAENGDAATDELAATLELRPDFPRIVESDLDIWCAYDALKSRILTGLRLAGLNLS